MFENEKRILLQLLSEHSNNDTKAWWENYIKAGAPFLGVKMPVVRQIVHQWYHSHIEGKYDQSLQVDLALALFDGNYTEEKLAGILFIHEILIESDAINCTHLNKFAQLFDENKIYDWNVCDWFCVKVLGQLIKKYGEQYALVILDWRHAKNLWRARSSLVAFVKVADEHHYYPAIENACNILIHRDERFAKTAVGWILREIANCDSLFVKKVIENNLNYFSLESLKNATKYFSKKEKEHYTKLLKNINRAS